MSSVTRSAVILGAVVAAAAGAFVLYTFDPSTASFYPPCVFRALTGLQCPGCGSTRAVHHLLRGRIAEAFRYNAMLVVFGPFLLIGAVAEARTVMRGAPAPTFVQKPWVAWTVIAVLIGWGVFRNLV